MTNPPKKPSEIILMRIDDQCKEGKTTTNYLLGCSVEAICAYLDSQADAYTTGYNQALKDVQGTLAKE